MKSQKSWWSSIRNPGAQVSHLTAAVTVTEACSLVVIGLEQVCLNCRLTFSAERDRGREEERSDTCVGPACWERYYHAWIQGNEIGAGVVSVHQSLSGYNSKITSEWKPIKLADGCLLEDNVIWGLQKLWTGEKLCSFQLCILWIAVLIYLSLTFKETEIDFFRWAH